jgi:hypothetical protein
MELIAYLPLLAEPIIALPPCCCISWPIVGFLLAIFVFFDAERRQLPGCLWAIVILILPVIGLIIYLVAVTASSDNRR